MVALSRGRVVGLVALLSFLALTSCVNLMEYVGKDANGNVRTSLVVTLSKSLLDMASQSGTSASEVFGSLDASVKELSSSVPPGVKVEAQKIDDPQQYGYHITLNYPETVLKEVKPGDRSIGLIPVRSGPDIVINMNLGQEESSQDSQDMSGAELLFASMKFQLFITKEYQRKITGAEFRDSKNAVALSTIDFGDFYLLEMPMLYLLQEKGEARITIHTT